MLYRLLIILTSTGALLPFIYPSNAMAAELEVQVFHQGQAAKKVLVCAGTIQQRELYVLTTTNNEGKVIFKNLPEGRIVITANKNRNGKEKIITSAGYQRNVMIALPDIEEGPVCQDITKEKSKE